MKHTRAVKTLTLTLLMTFALAAFGAQAADKQILTVAVFDFETQDQALADLGPELAVLVSANLSLDERLITVERAELNKLLGEQELGLSGTIQADTAAKVGQLTGAKVLVTGRAFEAGNKLLVVAKIISTETGRVYGAIVRGVSAEAVDDMATELATKIGDTIGEKGETLLARVRTRQERIDALKGALGGKPRPFVSVRIAERHFGGPVIDPAAETELALMLGETGFTVLDTRAKENPQIRFEGEAFSAYGLRKGNLFSCRARVELKAIEVATGRILATDRQTSVAVDIAEQTAAKSALQEAAAILAERMIPKVVGK